MNSITTSQGFHIQIPMVWSLLRTSWKPACARHCPDPFHRLQKPMGKNKFYLCLQVKKLRWGSEHCMPEAGTSMWAHLISVYFSSGIAPNFWGISDWSVFPMLLSGNVVMGVVFNELNVLQRISSALFLIQNTSEANSRNCFGCQNHLRVLLSYFPCMWVINYYNYCTSTE